MGDVQGSECSESGGEGGLYTSRASRSCCSPTSDVVDDADDDEDELLSDMLLRPAARLAKVSTLRGDKESAGKLKARLLAGADAGGE